ncbi:MAG: substrate-binding domain-containing protein [Lachnospiraceae bacterium]|nr:substrate-binding domain-containing protein [Lachnospiraceae bacterium]
MGKIMNGKLKLAAMCAAILTAALPASLIQAAANEDPTRIYVLTLPEGEGWTGSVARFAREEVAEIKEEGRYRAKVVTCSSAEDQEMLLRKIAGKTGEKPAVVVEPADACIEDELDMLADEGIPYVMFDSIIDGAAERAVSCVECDDVSIGAACASYFLKMGMEKGDRVCCLEGDSSLTTTWRDDGFIRFLRGETGYMGEWLTGDDVWSVDDISGIEFSGALGWSREEAAAHAAAFISDPANSDIKWIYAEDDKLALGVLDALSGKGVKKKARKTFLKNKPVIAGCGGREDLYAAIRGESFESLAADVGGIMSVTDSPALIRTAIRDMVTYLDGGEVIHDHRVEGETVTAENVKEYPSY